jgi:hypothetical protein
VALRSRRPVEAGADRLAAALAAARPYMDLAREDPKLQAALREVVGAGNDVARAVAGDPPRKTARRLASDRELQARLGSGARALGDSAVIVADERRRSRRHARAEAALAVVGGLALLALAAVAFLRRRAAAAPEDAVAAAGTNGGVPADPVRPAGSPSP